LISGGRISEFNRINDSPKRHGSEPPVER